MTPKLAIIILHKNYNHLLFDCLKSIQDKTKQYPYHVYIGDTGSSKENLHELQKYLKDNFGKEKNVSLISFDYYDFGKNVNEIIEKHLKDENLLVFCNNDIKFITDCLDEMVKSYLLCDNTGTVGAKLYYGNDTIQHKGIYLKQKNEDFLITHNNLGQTDNFVKESDTEVLGNTAALMMIDIDTFNSIGKFPFNYIDSLHDVEIALRCFLQNKKNILCGNALAYHYESQTRKSGGRLLTQDYNTLKQFIFNNIHELRNIL